MELHPPRLDRPVQLDEHLKLLPANATCRGLYFLEPLSQLRRAAPGHELFKAGALGSRRYLPFAEYPYADLLRLIVGAAPVLHAGQAPGEAVRRMGHGAYNALLSNQIGRVLFGVFGPDFDRVVMLGPRGYEVSINFGSLRAERMGPGHVRYRYERMPMLLETYQVGVVEGAMRACGASGEILVAIEALDRGMLDIRWSNR